MNFRALTAHELIVQNQAGNVKFNQTEADSANFNLMERDLTVNNSSFGRMDVAAKGNDLYFKNLTRSILNVLTKSGRGKYKRRFNRSFSKSHNHEGYR
ncbi:DUF4097 family beta strand repeat-containing protein [Paenibacillus sonchi]|uniref:DUF4097 family beta strand repeat-containing protein n=1 Tax=Paenibacillus sonchi TaxID=373687 RepID=UPI0038CD2042|nr:DUF4097 domain-containing protein [Paenibacillus sonchi]